MNFLASESLTPRREIILDKGRIVPEKEKKISSLKLQGDKILLQEGRRGFHQLDHINQEEPLLGKVSNSNCAYSLLSLHIFYDLIIREATDPPSPDRQFFAGLHPAVDA